MSKPEGTIEILINELNEAGILRLTLNDVGCRNALSEAMLTQLEKAFTHASETADIRVVILAANGSAFSAGHDLKELSAARKNSDGGCLLYTSPSPRDLSTSRMPSSA